MAQQMEQQNEIKCLLVEIPNKQEVSIAEGSNGSVIVSADNQSITLNRPLSRDILRLLPKGGKLQHIESSFFTSDIYTLIRLWKQNNKAQVYGIKWSGNKLTHPEKVDINKVIELIDETDSSDEAYAPKSQGNQPGTNKKAKDNKPKGTQTTVDTRKNDWEVEAINQRLLALVNQINDIYKLPKTDKNAMNSTDLLIDALKEGLERLVADKNSNGNFNDKNALYEELGRQRNELQTELDSLKLVSEADKEKIAELEKLFEDIPDLKADTLKALDCLIIDIKKGDFMFDCKEGNEIGDTQQIDDLESLKERLSAIKGDSDGGVRAAVKSVLVDELKHKDSVLNKLAILSAYGRLAFMIEPRDSGSYIVSSRMNSIYNNVVALLAPLGLQQVLPLLFVETLEDGDGRFEKVDDYSLLANYCPNLIQHKGEVDREQKENVITDIVLPGYTEDGEIKQKAKVIIQKN